MARRARQRGAQDIKRGVVTGWPPGFDPSAVAQRASYRPDGKHKHYPAPNGEWDYRFRAEGTTCPKIEPTRWPSLQEALQAAIHDGVVLYDELRGEFPARAWVYLDDRLCEARLSNPETGEYHGFPLDYEEHFPRDPHDLLRLAPRVSL